MTSPFGQGLPSFLLTENKEISDEELVCEHAYQSLIHHKSYFAVSDTTDYFLKNPTNLLANHFLYQKIGSFILASVVKEEQFLGVLEVISPTKKDLNSANANKLDVVMPFLTATIERVVVEFQNQIMAVIQDRYTTIHPSLNWHFREEARKLIFRQIHGTNYVVK